MTDLVVGHLNGVANIPGLGATLASVILVREESYETGQTIYGNDWLDLCLPFGALGNLDDRVGAYPFDDGSDSSLWRQPIEDWFATIAEAVFSAVPFAHAITGEEVSGVEPSEESHPSRRLLLPAADGSLARRSSRFKRPMPSCLRRPSSPGPDAHGLGWGGRSHLDTFSTVATRLGRRAIDCSQGDFLQPGDSSRESSVLAAVPRQRDRADVIPPQPAGQPARPHV
ncbi:MAG: hypothetical protein WAW85_06690 [Gordonia sp. (in: high G+C Gram-positive bacteria)]